MTTPLRHRHRLGLKAGGLGRAGRQSNNTTERLKNAGKIKLRARVGHGGGRTHGLQSLKPGGVLPLDELPTPLPDAVHTPYGYAGHSGSAGFEPTFPPYLAGDIRPLDDRGARLLGRDSNPDFPPKLAPRAGVEPTSDGPEPPVLPVRRPRNNIQLFQSWSGWRDLNPRPRAPEARALNQAELHPDIHFLQMVGVLGIEPRSHAPKA